jgi:hypothetical protein
MHCSPPSELNGSPLPLDPRLAELKRMVLDTVISPHSKRNYANALDHLFLSLPAELSPALC